MTTARARTPRDATRWLLFSSFVMIAALAAVGPMMPLYLISHHATSLDITLFLSLPLAVDTLIQLPAGRYIDRRGRREVLIASRLIFGVASLVLFIDRGPFWLLIVVRCAQGASTGAYMPALFATLADLAPPEDHAHRYAQLQAVDNVGGFVGPFMGAAAFLVRPSAVFGVAAIASLVVIVALSRIPESRTAPPPPPPTGEAHAPVPRSRGLLVSSASLAALGTVTGLYIVVWPQYITSRGYGPFVIGLTVSLTMIPMIAAVKISKRLSGTVDRRTIMGVAIPVVAVCLMAFPQIHALPLIIGFGLILMLAYGIAYPTLLASLSESAPLDSRGQAMAVGGFAETVGVTVGAAGSGELFGVNHGLPFIVTAAILAGAALLNAALLPRATNAGLPGVRFLENMQAVMAGHTIDTELLKGLGAHVREDGSPTTHAYLLALDAVLAARPIDPELLGRLRSHSAEFGRTMRSYDNARWRSGPVSHLVR